MFIVHLPLFIHPSIYMSTHPINIHWVLMCQTPFKPVGMENEFLLLVS